MHHLKKLVKSWSTHERCHGAVELYNSTNFGEIIIFLHNKDRTFKRWLAFKNSAHFLNFSFTFVRGTLKITLFVFSIRVRFNRFLHYFWPLSTKRIMSLWMYRAHLLIVCFCTHRKILVGKAPYSKVSPTTVTYYCRFRLFVVALCGVVEDLSDLRDKGPGFKTGSRLLTFTRAVTNFRTLHVM